MTETQQLVMQGMNRFMYFCYNYDYNFIERIWGPRTQYSLSEHLQQKFDYGYEKYGAYGVIPWFYSELDNGNRKKLLDYILTEFKGNAALSFNEES